MRRVDNHWDTHWHVTMQTRDLGAMRARKRICIHSLLSAAAAGKVRRGWAPSDRSRLSAY